MNNNNPDLPKIEFSQKGNFDLFSGIFEDAKFLTLLIELFRDQPKSVRTIIFPSEADLKKALAHRVGKLVIEEIWDWKKAAKFLREHDFFIDAWEVRRLYYQAEKETKKTGKNRKNFIAKMKVRYLEIATLLKMKEGL